MLQISMNPTEETVAIMGMHPMFLDFFNDFDNPSLPTGVTLFELFDEEYCLVLVKDKESLEKECLFLYFGSFSITNDTKKIDISYTSKWSYQEVNELDMESFIQKMYSAFIDGKELYQNSLNK